MIDHDSRADLEEIAGHRFHSLFFPCSKKGAIIRKQKYFARNHPGRRSIPWSAEDIQLVIAKDRPSDAELAAKLKRSIHAIQKIRHIHKIPITP